MLARGIYALKELGTNQKNVIIRHSLNQTPTASLICFIKNIKRACIGIIEIKVYVSWDFPRFPKIAITISQICFYAVTMAKHKVITV